MEETFFATESGRFDEVAAELLLTLTVGRIRRLIDSGDILLNESRAGRDAAVAAGDLITLSAGTDGGLTLEPCECRIPVLYENEFLIAIDKPAGLAVVPERNASEWPLMSQLLGHAANCPVCKASRSRFRVVHRIDRDTSGVLVLGRGLEAARRLSAAFAGRRVRKTYLALVRGEPPAEEGVVDVPIAATGSPRRPMAISRSGKESLTRWRVRERFRGFALLEVEIATGRTHQIRVHLEHEGMPLAVDGVYGGARALYLSDFKRRYRAKGDEKPLVGRLTLHSARLAIEVEGQEVPLVFEAELPADLARALKALRKHA